MECDVMSLLVGMDLQATKLRMRELHYYYMDKPDLTRATIDPYCP